MISFASGTGRLVVGTSGSPGSLPALRYALHPLLAATMSRSSLCLPGCRRAGIWPNGAGPLPICAAI